MKLSRTVATVCALALLGFSVGALSALVVGFFQGLGQ